MPTGKSIIIRAYTTKELEIMYGVSRNTFRSWLKPFLSDIGEKQGRYFNGKQVTIIFDKLGLPFKEVKDD